MLFVDHKNCENKDSLKGFNKHQNLVTIVIKERLSTWPCPNWERKPPLHILSLSNPPRIDDPVRQTPIMSTAQDVFCKMFSQLRSD